MTTIQRTGTLASFSCLGDKCEDTCCQNWSMQVDEPTMARYRAEAPELLDAVEAAVETPWIMRKDAATGMCVKLEGGLCGIHKSHGDKFLGDACHFYPRVTRALGDKIIMTATMSCPEIVRLALAGDDPCALGEAEVDRLPHSLKDYLPPALTPPEAFAVHQAFVDAAGHKDFSPEMNFIRIASVARSIERVDVKSWPQAAPFYFAHVGSWLPMAEKNIADPFNIAHALCGLIVASKKNPSARLKQTIDDMERALAITLDWQQAQIHTSDNSLSAYETLEKNWKEHAAEKYAPVLRRWLAMQMSLSLIPFAGPGATAEERMTIIGVRLATIKLALMCSHGIYGDELPQDVVVRVVQSLSRFLDHLGDPAFSLAIYSETGWSKENRMRGLLDI